jgi:AcrR family transcriptional regulator
MRALTISELEHATGTPRSTIYFYVREGLLPPAQKAAASRAIYSDVHVALLEEIGRLKSGGAGLESIKAAVAPLRERQTAAQPDLVARRAAETRVAILQAAARQFARRGYKRTRIADVIREVGCTAPVFYSHFSTKRQLFVESFNVFVRWMNSLIEPPLVDEPDPAVRLIWRMYAYWGLERLSPDLLGLAMAEGLQEGAEARAAVQDALRMITEGTTADLRALRGNDGDGPLVPDELMAYGLFGAAEQTTMRARWDDEYDQRAVMLAHLFLYLSMEAAYTGRGDVTERFDKYRGLVDRLVEQGPPVPDRALS